MRADIPYGPAESYFIDMREACRVEMETLRRADPDKPLIVNREYYEFLYGDEGNFRKKYRHQRRNTEAEFEEHFAEPVRRYFAQSSIRHLPYLISLHSDDLYTPKPEERDDFCKWLEGEICLIDKEGAPSWHSWVIDRQGPGLPAIYTAFYPIYRAMHKGVVKSEIHVQVIGPGTQGNLQIGIHGYGGLNLDAIDRNVKKARSQLKETALSREQTRNIARVVVLAFATGIDPFDWEELFSHIAWLLEEYCDLSAIAVLKWVADASPPPSQIDQIEELWKWFSSYLQAPRVLRFIVCHNSWLQDVEPLGIEAFDERSIHIPSDELKRQT